MLRFLVAVDGTDGAMRAVRHVAELARRGLPIEAVVCHVDDGADPSALAVPEAQAFLAACGVKATPHQLAGDAGEQLAQAARAWHCDTIVVGRRGLGRIAGAVLGSVSAKVAKLADVPVMVVP